MPIVEHAPLPNPESHIKFIRHGDPQWHTGYFFTDEDGDGVVIFKKNSEWEFEFEWAIREWEYLENAPIIEVDHKEVYARLINE